MPWRPQAAEAFGAAVVQALKVEQVTHSTYTQATIDPVLLAGVRSEPVIRTAPLRQAPADMAVPVAAPGFQMDGAPLIKDEEAVAEFPSLQCPGCGSSRIRRANRTTLMDHLMRMFGMAPYRCRGCRRKFHRPQAEAAQ